MTKRIPFVPPPGTCKHLPPYGDTHAPLEGGFDFRAGSLHEAKIWAAEASAHDPDAPHPRFLLDLLRCPWPPDTKVLARTLPSIAVFVTAWEVADVAAANAEAAQCEPQAMQLGLVLDDTVPGMDDCSSPADLMLAMSVAYARLGRMPTMRDVQRRRVGLPDLAEFDAVGGWRAAVRRWRAEVGAVA